MSKGRSWFDKLIEQLAIRLMKQLAIPLSNQKTVAKWLVISPQAGKSLVITTNGKYIPRFHHFTPSTCTMRMSSSGSVPLAKRRNLGKVPVLCTTH